MYTDSSGPMAAGRDIFNAELASELHSPADLKAGLDRLQSQLGGLLEGALALPPPEPGEKLLLYGAGAVGRQLLSFYLARDRAVDCFADTSPARFGSSFQGRAVLNPEELPAMANLRVVVSVGRLSTARGLAAELLRQGLPAARIHNPHDKYGDLGDVFRIARNAAIIAAAFDRVERVFGLLDEQRSGFVYLNAIKARFLLPDDLAPLAAAHFWDPDQYWALPPFRDIPQAVLVDCGAADGDTLESFLAHTPPAWVRRIYAFEPLEKSFRLLEKKARALEVAHNLHSGLIDCRPCALGAGRATGYLRSGDQPAMLYRRELGSAEEGGMPFEIVSLDEAVEGPVSIIKADVEGFELDLLRGAAKLIRRWRPRLAICLYHEPEDVYAIPLFIRELVPDYRLAVRHHNPGPFETVLYAWPPEIN